jgi:DUF971 family protein
LDENISRVSDSGTPYVLIAPDSSAGLVEFNRLSKKVIEKIDSLAEIKKDKPELKYNPKEGLFVLKQNEKEKKINPLHLRKKCICAGCIDEMSGQSLLKGKTIPEDIYPVKLEEKGNYAVAVIWSDGHRSSIYPYKRLLSNEIESTSNDQ